jgi:ribosomal protein S18 acetylase RimI-like enzyme
VLTPGAFSKPELLQPSHHADSFDSGEPDLDNWLKNRARKNLQSRASSTYVTCLLGSEEIAGFYAVSMGQVLRSEVSGKLSRNMPTDVPCAVIGRLAVDHRYQGAGVGSSLLKHAIQVSILAGQHVACRAVIVHALNEAAAAFYKRNGFVLLPQEELKLAFDLNQVEG